MTYLKNRKPPVFLALLVALLFVPGCYSKPLRVKYGESHSISELLHVHDSPITWLSIGAKKYEYVMGDEPYYINVPSRSDIFFITSNKLQTEFVYHFVSLDDGREIAITVHHTILWFGLEAQSPTRGQISFEKVDGPKVVIVRKLDDHWWRYSFDLGKKTVVDERN